MEWIDLTVLIDEEYLEYPGDIGLKKTVEKSFFNDGYNMQRIETNMHVGTHIDAFKHVIDCEEGIESIDFNKLIGKAFVARPKIIDSVIDTLDIAKQYDGFGSILVIDLNFSGYFNTDKYYDYPAFDNKFVDFLITNNIEVIAFDIPSPKYKAGPLLKLHKDLLSNNILIVENLTNLDKLSKHVEFLALPLKIKGLDGSLTRCIAKNINNN